MSGDYRDYMDLEHYDTTVISDIKTTHPDTVMYVYWRAGQRYEKSIPMGTVDANYKTSVCGLFEKIHTSLVKGQTPTLTCYTNRQGQPTRFNLCLWDGFHSINGTSTAEMAILYAMFRQ